MPAQPPTSGTTGSPAPVAHLRVQRVRPAYRQVADELRTQILAGALPAGTRLPNEAELGRAFGVSRSTAREALRVLSSQHLVETHRGVQGGGAPAARAGGRQGLEHLIDRLAAHNASQGDVRPCVSDRRRLQRRIRAISGSTSGSLATVARTGCPKYRISTGVPGSSPAGSHA